MKVLRNSLAIMIFAMSGAGDGWSTDNATKTGRPGQAAMFQRAAEGGENTWRKLDARNPRLTSRELFTYALALAEADVHLERVAPLLKQAAALQDRDLDSKTHGNFLWYVGESNIKDRNAVEFSMKAGTILWIRHRDKLDEEARRTLRELMDLSIEGCLRHRVRSSYTNISLMNALNLILLGENLDRPDVAQEGYRRFKEFCLYTWDYGIHEYCSPTYYAVDLECLLLMERLCGRDEERQQARALLELFWKDVTLNWFEPADRPGGTCSRDYSYLGRAGSIHRVRQYLLGIPGDGHRSPGAVNLLLSRWKPDAPSYASVPRLVRQSWGPPEAQSRTYFICRDIALGTSAANYGAMDFPLVIDLPGEAGTSRCFFVPDGRGDPYGKNKIMAHAHMKSLHLKPFWTACQDKDEALALVAYRANDESTVTTNRVSHFVLRKDVDACWIGKNPVDLNRRQPFTLQVPPGTPVIIRKGTSAAAILGPSPSLNRGPQLVYDGNRFNVMRLSFDHGPAPGSNTNIPPFAAIHIRTGSGLESNDAFDAWRKRKAGLERIHVEDGKIELNSTSGLAIQVDALHSQPILIHPPPTRLVLELNGEDVGRPILNTVPFIKDFADRIMNQEPVLLTPGRPAYVEAEDAALRPNLVQAKDEKASGGAYIWTPGEIGEHGSAFGRATWKVHLERPGAYSIWGRVIAPTPRDDSFHVRVYDAERRILISGEWHTGKSADWTWRPVSLTRAYAPARFDLPAGDLLLELRSREDGTRIDRLMITADPETKPQE